MLSSFVNNSTHIFLLDQAKGPSNPALQIPSNEQLSSLCSPHNLPCPPPSCSSVSMNYRITNCVVLCRIQFHTGSFTGRSLLNVVWEEPCHILFQTDGGSWPVAPLDREIIQNPSNSCGYDSEKSTFQWILSVLKQKYRHLFLIVPWFINLVFSIYQWN